MNFGAVCYKFLLYLQLADKKTYCLYKNRYRLLLRAQGFEKVSDPGGLLEKKQFMFA